VDYRSAGTVEFIVDKNRNFYFLEMNTRIQVEHPVTELITGLDLVEWMIRVAAGEALSFGQEAVTLKGWSVETRVYAEDPLRNFMPSIGRLVRYREPPQPDQGNIMVRVDSGVEEGSEISMFYDPMIAKLVTHGRDRAAAIDRMRAALDAYYIRGTGNNTAFLASVLAHPRFAEGRLSTDFIDDEYPEGYAPVHPEGDLRDRFLAAAAFVHSKSDARRRQIGHAGTPVDPSGAADLTVWFGAEATHVAIRHGGDGARVSIEGREIDIAADWQIGEPLLAATIAGVAAIFQVDREGTGYRLTHGGAEAAVRVLTRRASELNALMPEKVAPDRSKFLLSPMPGLLVSVAVEDGAQVRAGEELAVVEAMKMENILHAVADGTVKKINAASGDSLAVDQIILEFE